MSILLILPLMVLANWYLKGNESTQIFSPSSVSLSAMQPAIIAPCSFSLISVRPLCTLPGKRYVTKALYVHRKLFGNRSQRTVSVTLQDKPEYTEMTYVLSWMSEKGASAKNFSLTWRKIDKETAGSLSYLIPMLVCQINYLSIVKG